MQNAECATPKAFGAGWRGEAGEAERWGQEDSEIHEKGEGGAKQGCFLLVAGRGRGMMGAVTKRKSRAGGHGEGNMAAKEHKKRKREGLKYGWKKRHRAKTANPAGFGAGRACQRNAFEQVYPHGG